MSIKLRVSAPSLPELRDFLADAEVDTGCEPVAVREADRFTMTVLADDHEFARLSTTRPAPVAIEVLPVKETATGLTQRGAAVTANRFSNGLVPRGLGKKE